MSTLQTINFNTPFLQGVPNSIVVTQWQRYLASVALLAQNASTVQSVNASGGSTGLTFTGGPITVSGTLTLGGTLGVASGGTGVTTSTGNGAVVLSTAPDIDLSQATGLPLGSGVTGTLAVVSGGTGATTSALACTNLGAAPVAAFTGYSATNTATSTTSAASFTFTPTISGLLHVTGTCSGATLSGLVISATGGTVANQYGSNTLALGVMNGLVSVTASTPVTVTITATQTASSALTANMVALFVPT